MDEDIAENEIGGVFIMGYVEEKYATFLDSQNDLEEAEENPWGILSLMLFGGLLALAAIGVLALIFDMKMK